METRLHENVYLLATASPMFYDLNIPWRTPDDELRRTIAFLDHLSYSVIAFNVIHTGKLPPIITNPIPANPFPDFPQIRFLSRITITIEDPATLNSNIISATKNFDLIAARPQTEKALQWLGGNNNPDIDILSLDISQRQPFPLRHNLFTNLIARGVAIEICYAAGIGDTAARRNIISNATGLIRGTRGRGLLISSEARRTADLRGPFDVINLATFWGMKQEFGMGDGRKVLLHSDARRLTYKGAVQVVNQEIKEVEKAETQRPKRKVAPVDVDEEILPPKGGKRRRVKKKAR